MSAWSQVEKVAIGRCLSELTGIQDQHIFVILTRRGVEGRETVTGVGVAR